MILEAKDISFRYDNGNRMILNHVTLSVEGGECVGLSAPSGFGKTTLCKILSGYEEPDGGSILLDGRSFLKDRGKCPVQMIWQHPEQSVDPRWRMEKVLGSAGISDAGLLKRLGIRQEWMDRFPSELSGGELQRFCIARALGSGTQILLADEITTMLDLVTQREIWNVLLKEAGSRRLGILVVSHSESLLEKICTRRMDLTA